MRCETDAETLLMQYNVTLGVSKKNPEALEGFGVVMIVCSPLSVRYAGSALCAGRAYATSA